MRKLLLFHTEMISVYFFWGNVLLRVELQKDAKNSNLEIYESAHSMKSGSMPLSINMNPMTKCKIYASWIRIEIC